MLPSALSAHLALLAAALAAEAICGYPPALFARIGHPVSWMGRLLGGLDTRLNRAMDSMAWRRAAGHLALALLLGAVLGACWLLGRVSALLPAWAGAALVVAAAASLPAQRSLHDHARRVADALDRQGLAAGRAAVGHIVGRDVAALDCAGVVRAAIESLAENFADAVVAPAFWCVVFGLPGMAAYKAINTADSMIGHRTPRHLAFGFAAARLDDIANLPASRLSGLFLAAAALALPGAHPAAALRAMWRDARHHRSPNAGWPEAAMAGALGLRLAGPRRYAGTLVPDGWMGDGRADATTADLRLALRLYRSACLLQFGAVAVALAGVVFLVN